MAATDNYSVKTYDGDPTFFRASDLNAAIAGAERLMLPHTAIVDPTGLPFSATNPLPVTVPPGGSFAGTEYTEDAVLPANPAAPALMLRRRDALAAGEVSADGDAIAAQATPKGELYTSDSAAGTLLTSIAALLTSQNSYVDGVEGLLGASAAASGVAPVAGSFSAAGQSATFTPIAGRGFNVSVWDVLGTFVGSVELERSFDGGTTWLQCAAARTGADSFVCQEPEFAVAYRLNCKAQSAGTLNYRISQ